MNCDLICPSDYQLLGFASNKCFPKRLVAYSAYKIHHIAGPGSI